MPSMKVEGDSDGDGEMSGGDTERSGGSSRGPDRDSSAEEADEPDSDDSSEMDESECERRRNECLDNLANLERQFTQLREQLYFERVKQVDHQLDEVRGGRSQEYLGPLRRLQENMRIRIEVAGILRQMRLENVKHKYEAEEQAAHQHFKMWCVFGFLFIVSVEARRYDPGPQRFYEAPSDSETSEPNDEVIVYLTPSQVKSLVANGAVVRPADDSESDPGLSAELPQENEEQDEASQQDENEEVQQEEDQEEEEEESPEQEQNQNQEIDFQEILRILNEQPEEEENAVEEPTQPEPQVEEENTEEPRLFSPRFNFQQQQLNQQQQERYFSPTVAKKGKALKSYSYVRYQPNGQTQKINSQLLQQQQADEAEQAEETSEEPQTIARLPLNKYKLKRFEVEETPENTSEENDDANSTQQTTEAAENSESTLLNANKLIEAISQRRNRLLQSELRLRSALRDLKASPNFNNQKYATETEKLKGILLKQNTLSKAEAMAKAAPALVKQQINKSNRSKKSNKQGKGPSRQSASQQYKRQKTEQQKLIAVPVETGKRVSVKALAKTGTPYIIKRKVPEKSEKRQSPTQGLRRKPERTIHRYYWDH